MRVSFFTRPRLAVSLERADTVSMLNYTGTLGFGYKYIQKLVERGISDRERQLVIGGSCGT